jgi:hypothetical protein
MPTRRNSIEGKLPFTASAHLAGLGTDDAARLAMVAGDITLVLDAAGRIVDVAANPREFPEAGGWTGREWLDTVTVESRPKVMEMLRRCARA